MEKRGDGASASVRNRVMSLVAALLVLAACGSAYGLLRPESDIPEWKHLLDLGAAAPAVGRHVDAGGVGGERLQLAMEERGPANAGRVDVLIHGVLSDARTWRYVAADLACDRGVLLVDLPGCGGSDKPDPDVVGDEGYSPSAMAVNVLAGLREWLATRRDRPQITLVGHSLGTAVVLRMLGDLELRREYADVLDAVDRAVLLAPLTFAFEKPDPLFERIASLTAIEVTMAEVTGILRGAVADTVWNGVCDPTTVPREEADRLFEILSDGQTRRAAQAMIRVAVPFNDDGRCDWPRIERLEDDYANVTVPCLLVCGARDETLPQAMAFRLRQMLPRAWLRVIPHAMHTLPTERPGECADFVRRFDTSGGEGWKAFEDWRTRARAEPVAVGQ